MVKLYAIGINGLLLMGYGVISKMEEYARQGYIVIATKSIVN